MWRTCSWRWATRPDLVSGCWRSLRTTGRPSNLGNTFRIHLSKYLMNRDLGLLKYLSKLYRGLVNGEQWLIRAGPVSTACCIPHAPLRDVGLVRVWFMHSDYTIRNSSLIRETNFSIIVSVEKWLVLQLRIFLICPNYNFHLFPGTASVTSARRVCSPSLGMTQLSAAPNTPRSCH